MKWVELSARSTLTYARSMKKSLENLVLMDFPCGLPDVAVLDG